jgi:DNA-binding transcriptional LysR family regulator
MDASFLPALYDALVVAQTSSVAVAAKRLHKTPSAISQQLRRLEDHLGFSLFEKAGRGIRPSPAGEAALGALTRVFDEASSLFTLFDELGGARVPTLRVAAADYLGEAVLLPVIREFSRERIPLHFEITTTHSVAAGRLVTEGLADVGIVSSDRELGAGETMLFRQPFFWVAPRPRRAPARARSVVARLGREPLLRLSPGSRGRRLLDEYLGRTGIRPVTTIDLPSVSLLLSYASQGLGIGLAPGLALERFDNAARKRVVIERADVPEVEVRLFVRPSLRREPSVQRFLDRLTAVARRAGAASFGA